MNSVFVDLIGLFSHTLLFVPIWAVHYNEEKMNLTSRMMTVFTSKTLGA